MFILITLWILLSPTQIKELNHFHDSFIVWNVGQGQWATLNTLTTCYHFDLGGERFPLAKIKARCRSKKNEIFISHWDLDHMSALRYLARWPRVCRREDPLGSSVSAFKTQLLFHFKPCAYALAQNLFIKKIFPYADEETWLPEISNAKSKVFIVGEWLIPGDSRIEEEVIWANRLQGRKIKGLIIGHHGSKTSSSELLIRNLPDLHWAISSARWRRYKHPHPAVLINFKKQKKRILRTEYWGNFYFET